MLLSLFFIFATALGGLALTYVFAEDETLLWRFSAGAIIGSALCGLAAFILASAFGLSAAVVVVALLASAAPLFLLMRKTYKKRFAYDRARAKGKLQGANRIKTLRFLYYFVSAVILLLFFERAMFETGQGVFTGASQNLGDLPFHLGAIFSFADGNNFPPQNPSFAGAKFSYPFIADLLTACLVKLGAGVKDAMLVQNVVWAFALLVVLENFVFKLTSSRAAGKIAPALLFFSGGLGFLWFFNGVFEHEKGFFDFFYNLPRDYTIYEPPPGSSGERFRWGNALVTLFITQRSLLLGMPLTLIVLHEVWKIFSAESAATGEMKRNVPGLRSENSFSVFGFPLSAFFIGLLAGTLPLIHLHSLAVLFVVGVFALVVKPEKWRLWIGFGVGAGVSAVPALIWASAGSATRASEFVAFHFGWDARDDNFLWFWIKNTGLFIPLLIFGLIRIWSNVQGPKSKVGDGKSEVRDEKAAVADSHPRTENLLLFYLPFLFIFVAANLMKFAPWAWDNIKLLIYWFAVSLPFVAVALIWLYERGKAYKILAAICFAVLIFSGALDVWRVASGQINYRVFDADAVELAAQIKEETAPGALFLNAPTYNTAIVLTGRQSVMRYIGHLTSHGIDYEKREADVKRIYEGGAGAGVLLREYGIEYVLISPEERRSLAVNEGFFQKYPVVAESGEYKVYKVR